MAPGVIRFSVSQCEINISLFALLIAFSNPFNVCGLMLICLSSSVFGGCDVISCRCFDSLRCDSICCLHDLMLLLLRFDTVAFAIAVGNILTLTVNVLALWQDLLLLMMLKS